MFANLYIIKMPGKTAVKTKKKGKKKSSSVDIVAEAKASYYAYLAACKLRKCQPNERVTSAFNRVINEMDAKESGEKKKKKKKGPKGVEVVCHEHQKPT